MFDWSIGENCPRSGAPLLVTLLGGATPSYNTTFLVCFFFSLSLLIPSTKNNSRKQVRVSIVFYTSLYSLSTTKTLYGLSSFLLLLSLNFVLPCVFSVSFLFWEPVVRGSAQGCVKGLRAALIITMDVACYATLEPRCALVSFLLS